MGAARRGRCAAGAHAGFVERFRPRVVSTTLALAWVAAGKRAAYVTDGGDLSGSVHFAAGIAVCRAAGCVITGIDGAPIGQASHGPVVAADAKTHGLLMSMIHSRNQCCDRIRDSSSTSRVTGSRAPNAGARDRPPMTTPSAMI
ncbi:inositol monophosphatase family protein [Nonomuraea sp. ZG12]|uniref:inositol monophosphatase family protein n=1 Tax=Nonomuraea sp. ZG12 TaxID=3452207 RepID=UPI003F898625